MAVLLLDPADHDRDELTLLRWVAKEFGLPTPRARRTLGSRRFENLRQRQSFAKYG